MKNTTRELGEAYTSFNSQINEAEGGYQRLKINSMKQNEKASLEKKRVKRNEQNLQEIWNYVKRPNLCLIGIPEYDRKNESKLENALQDIIQENWPNLARQAKFKSRKYKEHHIDILQEEQPQGT